jgi:hypothetical protein
VPAVRARWVQRPLHWVDQPVPARRSPAKEPVAERLLRRAPPTRWAVREGEQRPARAVRAAAAAALVEALRLRLRAARVDVLLVDKAAVQERACPQNSTLFNFSICVPSLSWQTFILELYYNGTKSLFPRRSAVDPGRFRSRCG